MSSRLEGAGPQAYRQSREWALANRVVLALLLPAASASPPQVTGVVACEPLQNARFKLFQQQNQQGRPWHCSPRNQMYKHPTHTRTHARPAMNIPHPRKHRKKAGATVGTKARAHALAACPPLCSSCGLTASRLGATPHTTKAEEASHAMHPRSACASVVSQAPARRACPSGTPVTQRTAAPAACRCSPRPPEDAYV